MYVYIMNPGEKDSYPGLAMHFVSERGDGQKIYMRNTYWEGERNSVCSATAILPYMTGAHQVRGPA